ncbi:MarR family transcriptional regulator [Catenulispora sp. NF23]|uniref:helix-turn-helix transcriptional regulator n=1 Tax=Catenulispora pinistramenti TaxID=2705254 RepID=UPI001BACD8AC|nr:MarR family transcriptional regulator [Catenulispora pinistramenti]MBS2532824.1 MarR family transcriptional regulator [Catenulispora pinistramenti]
MEADERRKWTLLTSHGHVLVEIARNPQARVRDLSAIIGITERTTQAIIADLERAGYVERVKIGRRTHYVLHPDNPFRHAAQEGLQVGPFLDLLTGTDQVDIPTPEETFLAAAVMPLPSEPAPEATAAAPTTATAPAPGALPITEPGTTLPMPGTDPT